MLYWRAVGVVLHESLSPKGGWHRPWKRLSGVRFSWNMTTTCLKGVGSWILRVSRAWAGTAPEQASTRRRNKLRGMRFIFFLRGMVLTRHIKLVHLLALGGCAPRD